MKTLARKDDKPLGPGMLRQPVHKSGWDDWIDEDDEDARLMDLGRNVRPRSRASEDRSAGGLRGPKDHYQWSLRLPARPVASRLHSEPRDM